MIPMSTAITSDRSIDSPFLLANEAAYARWREQKLVAYPLVAADLLLDIGDPYHLTAVEHAAILQRLSKCNMLVYNTKMGDREDKEIPRELGRQLGLIRLDPNMLADDDGITSLTVVEGKQLRGYIPYSNKRLLWHTDGYYNSTSQQIRAIILHCVRPAVSGGENALLDPEMVYMRLRDENPEYIQALMHPSAMTIPANTESGSETRPAVSGPVFSLDPQKTGCLHMRYTARTRSIEWRESAETTQAVERLRELMADDSPYVFHYRLESGQGLLCNNVLHSRTAFEQTEQPETQRLLYRARYYERVSNS